MFAALLILSGLILGVALSILVLILVKKNETAIITTLNKYAGTESHGTAYIAGLSDEESAFRTSLPDDKQVEIQ